MRSELEVKSVFYGYKTPLWPLVIYLSYECFNTDFETLKRFLHNSRFQSRCPS